MDAAAFAHHPVLAAEVTAALAPAPGRLYLDATVGGGGHAERLLEAGARILGVDRDDTALAAAAERLARFGDRVRLVRGAFADLPAIVAAEGVGLVDGILADLGVSSLQLDDPGRGFSFQADGPLDMRMDQRERLTAADLVNALPVPELTRLIRTLGEERWAGAIARRIARARAEAPIETTGRLAEVVVAAVAAAERHPASRPGTLSYRAGTRRGRTGRRGRIHPATRTFQALRMRVNDELEQLARLLDVAPDLLEPGGRLAVISFHSLEDRLVKEAIRREAAACRCPPGLPVCRCGQVPRLRPVTRKPITPGEAEVAANPRARSAKLRVAERI